MSSLYTDNNTGSSLNGNLLEPPYYGGFNDDHLSTIQPPGSGKFGLDDLTHQFEEQLTLQYDQLLILRHDEQLTLRHDEQLTLRHDEQLSLNHDEKLTLHHDEQLTLRLTFPPPPDFT